MLKRYCWVLAGIFSIAASAKGHEVVVYSARNEQLIKPVFDAYQQKTGIKVKYITGEAGALMQRLKAEGKNTPADVLITVDAGNLWFAKQEALLQPLKSAVLEQNIPAHLRDVDGQWFGMSVRARTIVYNKKKVQPGDLSSYQALTGPQWKSRLCLLSGKKVYNRSLVAMLIAQYGERQTKDMVKGWVANLAAAPFASDEQALKALAAGQCDAAIANSYYLGRELKHHADWPLGIFWANQDSGGTHVNISGVGLTRYAKHAKAAQDLLEWMSTPAAMSLFANVNMEFPANPAVAPAPEVAAWGPFKHNTTDLNKVGALQPDAVKLMDEVGYK